MRTETVKLYTCLALLFFVGYATLDKSTASTFEELEPVVVSATPRPKPEAVIKKPNIDREQLECLAMNIYHEARSESTQGQLAVAHVTLNRVAHHRFPNNICDVVKQARYSRWWKETHNRDVPVRNQCQFSWYCDGKSDRIYEMDVWREISTLAVNVLLDKTKDPTKGAIYYYNPTLADPFWKNSFQQVAMVDNHVFLR